MTEPTPGSTEDRGALQWLAQQLGLAPRYHDFFGVERDVPDATLRAALHAMGVPAADDAQVHAALHAHGDASRQQKLPPALVLREGYGAHGLLVPHAEGTQGWRLRLESGEERSLPIESRDGNLRLVLPEGLPLGYHRLENDRPENGYTIVIVTPARCWVPQALQAGHRWWGPCVQLYALRSSRNWGIGDLTDLRVLINGVAGQGASFVGLNPLHALFPHRPEVASPYSPSSRNMLNPVYLDVEAVPGYADCPEAQALVDGEDFQRRVQALREAEMVDYAGVAALKNSVLELLWRHFRAHLDAGKSASGRQFRDYLQSRGEPLRAHALFEALQSHFFAADAGVWGWPAWPEAYRDPEGEAVADFAREHAVRVEYYAWLQWNTESQLASAQQRALQVGMGLGLYRDLAVGVNEGGSETWSEPSAYALGMHVGAPPDALNALGQNWGLPPLNPNRLLAGRYQPFIDTLRANMRHAGALRLDHVMGLMRLFWISPSGGSYVSYPLDDLLGILALESVRHRCMVIGEDLGNVAPQMREAMRDRALLSYRPLFFERGHDGSFTRPQDWQHQAFAVVSTHDLPTLRGFWNGDDIEIQAQLKLYPNDDVHTQQVLNRAQDRAQLLLALDREGLLPPGVTVHPPSMPESTTGFTDAVYAFLARTPSLLVGVQLEDVTQQRIQVNVPGTGEDVFPNWRRKLSVDVEDLAADPRMLSVAGALRDRREGPSPQALAATELPPLSSARIPEATYRVQFHAGLTFDQVTAVVPYLHALGISHLYASPYLKARPGSTHGYDIVDHNALNPEVGDEQAFDRLCRALRRHGMHQMLDIVPNHMGVLEADNAWWLDVLENGPSSRHAQTFDIEWEPAAPEMAGKVLLPVLGDHYGQVLEAGELQTVFVPEAGEFWVHYYDHRFPVDPRDYASIFEALPIPVAQNDEQRDAQAVVQSLLHGFATLPARDDTGEAARAARERDGPVHKRALARQVRKQSWLEGWIAGCLKILNGTAGQPGSFDALDALIRRQAWRPAYWRVAGDDINYRRFFDVNTLAGLRMERDEVFDATHRRVLRWLQEGRIAALRIDHPDGLSDPQAYFDRLQGRHAALADAAGVPRKALYLVVEKILAEHEPLPPEWLVHGGTGYRFSSLVNTVLVDPRGEQAFDALYREFTGETGAFDEVLYEAKHLVIENALWSELSWLTEALYRISRRDRRTCDFTRNRLGNALAMLAACFPVYRTYIRSGDAEVRPQDRAVVDQATECAKRRSAGEEITVLDHLRNVLLGACAEQDPERRARVMRFVIRWQQFTAPVMAKSMEDTAFYRYNRLVALNDVGGDPRHFGMEPDEFHAANAHDIASRPHWLLGTSTHDSKRSEDLRARLDVLSEMPHRWHEAILRWHALAAPLRTAPQAPSRNDEYLLWQTLVGVWPLQPLDTLGDAGREDLRQRVADYMQKAVREAKQHTSWLNPVPEYEDALSSLIGAVFDPERGAALRADIEALVADIAPYGCWNSLALVGLKLTSPGVPDIYHGCEHWNFSLVDPDNRRPVDFGRLARTLRDIQALYDGRLPQDGDWRDLFGALPDGRLKQLVTWRLLRLRARRPEVFARGGYTPLAVRGEAARHVVAFARGAGADQAVTVAGRLLHSLVTGDGRDGMPAPLDWRDAWGASRLALPPRDGGWADWITGTPLPAEAGISGHALARILATLPLAVLVPAHWLKED